MLKVFVLALALAVQGATAISGPFVLWGVDSLQQLQVGPLQEISADALQALYTKASKVLVFGRNANSEPVKKNAYPKFTTLLNRHPWTYLAQDVLAIGPAEKNENTEVFRTKYFNVHRIDGI